MLGAILGDIIGSRFEFNNIHVKDFELLHPSCRVTDDSIMTIAVMKTIMESDVTNELDYKKHLIANFKEFYKMFPDGDYGCRFTDWLESDDPLPYNSYGNGACMRVSPCAIIGTKLTGDRAKVTKWTTEVSHDHPIALSWAEWLTYCIQELNKNNWNSNKSKRFLQEQLDLTKEEGIKHRYYESATEPELGIFDETCQGTMPIAVRAVLEAEDFYDAVRTAVSFGGDSDTIAAIAGSLAEPIFGINHSVPRAAFSFIPFPLRIVVSRFRKKFKFGSL